VSCSLPVSINSMRITVGTILHRFQPNFVKRQRPANTQHQLCTGTKFAIYEFLVSIMIMLDVTAYSSKMIPPKLFKCFKINVKISKLRKSIGAGHEFCHLETFRARCHHGDVVVMDTALFGRMRVGRCITSDAYLTALQQLDPTSLGCSADVLAYMDQVCSGRSSCDVSVASPALYEFRPCPGQLMMYLEATYSCLTGTCYLFMYMILLINNISSSHGHSPRG